MQTVLYLIILNLWVRTIDASGPKTLIPPAPSGTLKAPYNQQKII
jgi:hypothetical protein